ncbi:MAG: type I polyketide synthase, partial [Acidobacteriota bacterium]|jgi:enediyne polyketide synthase
LEQAYKAPFPAVDEETLAGGLSNTIAGRICNHLDLGGGGYTVDGACASSLLAVAHGCSALAVGDLDVALAGGVDVSLDPFELVGFAKTGALAEDSMRVYDARSGGFWPGEGAGAVVLMRLEDAVASGHPVRAVIRGWGISSDGSGGITRPNVEGQVLALRRAYRRAGFGADTVAYFEGHGTGTAVGDATELRALCAVRRGARTRSCVGSIKANIGHTKAAAGLAGLLKAILAVQRQVIPPHTGVEEPHPELLAPEATLRLARTPELWPAEMPLRAAVSAMGFGGINSHVVLESPVTERRARLSRVELTLARTPQDAELFLFTAPGPAELRERVESLVERARGLSLAELSDFAASLGTTLEPEGAAAPVRAAVTASTPDELAERLGLLARGLAPEGADDRLEGGRVSTGVWWSVHRRPAAVGFLFSGQGSPTYAELDGGALRRRFGDPGSFGRELLRTIDPDGELPGAGTRVDTAVVQPRIVAASLAGLSALERLGVGAAAAVGHSLGELTALHWAGVMSGESLLRLAAARGRAMADEGHPGGAMAALEASAEEVAGWLEDGVVIAGLNGPRQTVISGEAAAVEAMVERVRAAGRTATRLRVSHAFHSPLVADAATHLAEALECASFRPVCRRVGSTVTGSVLEADAAVDRLLLRQLTSPVRFVDAVRAVEAEVDLWIEVGPGDALSGLVGRFSDRPAVSLDAGSDSLRGFLESVGAAFVLGAPVGVRELFADRFTRRLDPDRSPRFLTSPCEEAPRLRTAISALVPTAAPAAGDRAEPSPEAAGDAVEEPLELVRRLVARRAELPADMVFPESRLLSDLHLSSISVGQVAAEAADRLGIEAVGALGELADATISEVAETLVRLGEGASPTVAEEVSPEPPGVDTWVAAWVVEPDERALRPGPPADGGGSWEVVAPEDHPLVRSLGLELGRGAPGPGVALCLPPEPDPGSIELFLDAARRLGRLRPGGRFLLVHHGVGGGFGRSLHFEMPDVAVCVCGVPPGHSRSCDWIVDEVRAATVGYREVSYAEDGRRLVPALRPLPALPAGEPVLGSGDVLVVTGGGRGIATECAAALARGTGTRLLLLGRSRPEAVPELGRNLEQMRADGIRHLYVPCDITDPAAVREALERSRAELGPVTAVLHGAGINAPALIPDLEPETFRRTWSTKVDGAKNLWSALDTERVHCFVSFGSIIARVGMAGEAHYATANEGLAAWMEKTAGEHPECRFLTIEWSVWSGVGMGERLGRVEDLSRRGVMPIPPDEGIRWLRSLLAGGATGRVVVAGRFGRPDTLELARDALPLRRFLESPRAVYPGVELVVDTTLSAETDPYLVDHAYRGELLFPAVLGLEAMAQVAMALVGTDRVPVFEDLRFDRPVTVDAEGRTTVRVAALVRDPGRVEVVVRSRSSGFRADHFRALLRFDRDERAVPALAQPETPPLALDPVRDLYGGVLFHGGRFRRLQGYRRLRATECLADISPDGSSRWFGAYLPGDLVLGDPAARDAAIHGIQACIPHATVLPLGVDRVVAGTLDGRCAVRAAAVERSREGPTFVYDLEITDAEGRLCERWEGLRLRAVDRAPEPPSLARPLLGPYLERRLGELAPDAMLRVALDLGSDDDGLSDADRVLGEVVGNGTLVRAGADGEGARRDGLETAWACAGPLMLAVASRGSVDCDLRPIEKRPAASWEELLDRDRLALAGRIAAEAGDDFDTAATRVWTTTACLDRSGGIREGALGVGARTEDGWLLFSNDHRAVWTVALPVPDLGGRAVFAVLTKEPVETEQ